MVTSMACRREEARQTEVCPTFGGIDSGGAEI
jgi:hypothetical protein